MPINSFIDETLFTHITVDCLQRQGMFTESTSSPRTHSLVRQGSNASYLSNASVDGNLDSLASGTYAILLILALYCTLYYIA